MAERFSVMIAQLNPVVGDLEGNAARARRAWAAGRAAGADLVALSEMFITGYNPQDLVMKPAFVGAAEKAIEQLMQECADGPALAIGGPCTRGNARFNACHVLAQGARIATVCKHHLPNVSVFDEKRQFDPGQISGPFRIAGLRIGAPICEDAWHQDVCETLVETGAELLIVPNGSPYSGGKFDVRMNQMVARVVETGLPLVYVNMVGGQDDQVFDGGSFALNPGGRLALQLPKFEEAMELVEIEHGEGGWTIRTGGRENIVTGVEADYRAMVLGLGDFMRKSGFDRALLGLSGGVDSALVATIATDAVGAENIRCVRLPSSFTSAASLEDAAELTANLGCRLDDLPIEPLVSCFDDALAPLFAQCPTDLTEENLQARIRGILLMALSNKFDELLLSTGNKSELAVGYATLYGDMAGGFNPIKDLYKTRVYDACRWRNAHHRPWMRGPEGAVIPVRILEKAPSAELRPDQKDSDSLPDYAQLDAILARLVDDEKSVADCVAAGLPVATVKRVAQLVQASQFKRAQAAPGVRLTERGFGLDRRYPIVNRWQEGV